MDNTLNSQSVTIGSFFGIKVRIHISWLIIFALIAWTVIGGYLPTYFHGLSVTARIIEGLVITIVFFITVVAHEFAHALVARRRGLKISRITLFLFGGAAELQQEPADAKTEFLMTLAGPATSVLASAVFGLMWYLGGIYHVKTVIVIGGIVALLNLVIAVFNLLPAYPLDGGRIFRSLVWMRTKDIVKATKIASYLSYVLSYLLIAFGILAFLEGDFIDGIWSGLLGIFLHQITTMSYRQTLSQSILGKLKVNNILQKDFISVPSDTTVNDFLRDYVLKFREYDFLVSDSNDIIGIIEAPNIKHASVDRESEIRNYMSPITKDLHLKTTDSADKALAIMQRHGLHILPVYSGSNVIAVVTAAYINDYLLIHHKQPGDVLTRR